MTSRSIDSIELAEMHESRSIEWREILSDGFVRHIREERRMKIVGCACRREK